MRKMDDGNPNPLRSCPEHLELCHVARIQKLENIALKCSRKWGSRWRKYKNLFKVDLSEFLQMLQSFKKIMTCYKIFRLHMKHATQLFFERNFPTTNQSTHTCNIPVETIRDESNVNLFKFIFMLLNSLSEKFCQ